MAVVNEGLCDSSNVRIGGGPRLLLVILTAATITNRRPSGHAPVLTSSVAR